MPSCFNGPTVAGVQTFDRIGGANHFPDLDVIVEEGDEFFPRVLPQSDDRGVSGAPLFFQRLEGVPCSIGTGSGINGLQIAFEFVPVFFGREPE